MQGAQIARQYAERNGSLRVHDRRPEAMAAFASDLADVVLAETLADLADGREAIGICVMNDEQLEAVLLGADGLLGEADPGAVLVIHSTVSPALVLRIAEQAAQTSVRIVDAPVSGGSVAGQAMSFMVGGDPEAVRLLLPLLGEVDVDVTLTGGTGTGAGAKLAHQAILCGNVLAAGEGMALASLFGVSEAVMRQVARLGTARSAVAQNWTADLLGPPTTSLLLKDLDLCLRAASSAGLDLAGTRAAETAIREMQEAADRRPRTE